MLEIDSPEAVDKLRQVLFFDPSKKRGLTGHRVRKTLDKAEKKYPDLHFHCHECDEPMGRGKDRVCDCG